jgi:hypothetical protein
MAPQATTPHFATQSRTILSGSEKSAVALPVEKRAAGPGEQMTVSVIVRRKKPLAAAHVSGRQRVTRSRFNADHGADPEAVALVKRFAREFGLKVEAGTPRPGRRMVKLTGTARNMERAFGVSLGRATIEGETYRVREGKSIFPPNFRAMSSPSSASTIGRRRGLTSAFSANRVRSRLKPQKAAVLRAPMPLTTPHSHRSRSASSISFQRVLPPPAKPSASSNWVAASAKRTLPPISSRSDKNRPR